MKNEVVEEIRSKIDIVDVVSDHVALRKRGKNFLGLCPFHNEKTASFTVSQEKQLFHCFGCGEGGNAFSFLMKIQNISFWEAAKILADKLGIPLEIDKRYDSHRDKDKDKVVEIMEAAVKFYISQIKTSSAAIEYFKKRGLDSGAVSTFKLGYSPDNWDSLYRHLVTAGFLPTDIEKAGLTISKEGGSFYDRFRNRIMFPIFDVNSRPIGFGARSLDGSEPKYLNSPETSVYNKSNVLYGLNFSKDSIKRSNYSMIVEGYMDMIACYVNGFTNVVASSGTALTMNQVKVLRKFSENIVLIFDSDSAGSLATERSIEMLSVLGIYPKVAILSGGKDPDEILKKDGKERFAEILRASVPWLRYRIDNILKKHNIKDPEGKSKAIREAAVLLAKEKDSIIRNEYISLLSERTNTDKDMVSSEIKKIGYQKQGYERKEDAMKKPDSKLLKAEKLLIRLAVEDADLRNKILAEITPLDFSEGPRREIFEKISGLNPDNKTAFSSAVMDEIAADETKKHLSEILFDEHEFIEKDKMLSDCINVIKAGHTREKIELLRKEIDEAEKVKDLEKLSRLQNEFKTFHEELRAF